MSNVVSMERSCEYLVRKAAARRSQGNYDGAMTLLVKARDQYGLSGEIEIELARTYDMMGCEEEAETAYLRVARMGGPHRQEALFNLALSSAQRGDLPRAASSYGLFMQGGEGGVSAELSDLLGAQLREELERPAPTSRKGRARALIRCAVERMQEGKTAAARRALRHALALRESAQAHTLLACCALLEGKAKQAVESAKTAHRMAPGRVQTMCVLADAYALADDEQNARRTLLLASMRAVDPDDVLGVAMESAKLGDDALTLRLTHRLLKLEPTHTRAMMLRACALTNLGRLREASRLFGRLCVLLPENTVCEALYRMTREGDKPDERLTLGLDVPRQEAVSRAMELIAALYVNPQELAQDRAKERALCRLSAWAFRSPVAGPQVATAALLLMGAMDTPGAENVLLDGLTDAQLSDEFKGRILQALCQKEGMKPYLADIGGRLVYLAAGGVTQKTHADDLCREIVQRAADRLLPAFRDAPALLMDMWLAYIEQYGPPQPADASACAAALEYAYHMKSGRRVDVRTIARREFVPPRLCAFFTRRMLRALERRRAQEPEG